MSGFDPSKGKRLCPSTKLTHWLWGTRNLLFYGYKTYTLAMGHMQPTIQWVQNINTGHRAYATYYFMGTKHTHWLWGTCNLLFNEYKTYTLAMGNMKPPIQLVRDTLSLGGEADHSPPSTAAVKNE
jgi:hypothetical protein